MYKIYSNSLRAIIETLFLNMSGMYMYLKFKF